MRDSAKGGAFGAKGKLQLGFWLLQMQEQHQAGKRRRPIRLVYFMACGPVGLANVSGQQCLGWSGYRDIVGPIGGWGAVNARRR